MQNLVMHGHVIIMQVLGTENVADLGTNYSYVKALYRLREEIGLRQ